VRENVRAGSFCRLGLFKKFAIALGRESLVSFIYCDGEHGNVKEHCDKLK
jgi:hypothetical protein